jgi:hypothetical protein
MDMKIRDLDQHPTGNKPLTNVVRWLRTCLAKCENWSAGQHEAASQDLAQAEEVLDMELSPNVTQTQMMQAGQAINRPTPLQRIIRERYVAGAHLELTPEEVAWLNLYESALLERLDATLAILQKMKVRVAFIDWPAEHFWNAGTEVSPRWVPDWRQETMMIEAALNGVPFGKAHFEKLQENLPLPWNRIPEEHRPSHLSQGAKRLHKLHLAYLRYKERKTERRLGDATYNSAEWGLLRELEEVFEGAPVQGGSIHLRQQEATA